MLKIVVFIFLVLFIDINNVCSQFFMPENARSNTTFIKNVKPISRITNDSKIQKKSINQKQIIKQKPARKLFMATNTDKQQMNKISKIEKTFHKNSEKMEKVASLNKKESVISNEEKKMIEENDNNNHQINIFDEIEKEYKQDLKNISNGTYIENPRIKRVLSSFQDIDHRI